jgi:hypothetical protein
VPRAGVPFVSVPHSIKSRAADICRAGGTNRRRGLDGCPSARNSLWSPSRTKARPLGTDARSDATEARQRLTEARTGGTKARSWPTQARSKAIEAWSGATQARSEATEAWSAATQARSAATDARSGATQARSETTDARSEVTKAQPTAAGVQLACSASAPVAEAKTCRAQGPKPPLAMASRAPATSSPYQCKLWSDSRRRHSISRAR